MATSLFQEVVPEIDANPERKRVEKTKLVHASTTASSSSAMLEQATLDTSFVSCRDVTSQVEFGLTADR